MSDGGSDTWTYKIPGSSSTGSGVRFKVTATNSYGLTGSEGYLVGISYPQEGLPIPYTTSGTTLDAYSIIAIPLKLTSNAVNAVFGPVLGQYGDKDKWRMFHYRNGVNEELNGSSQLERGKGYWLISSKAATLNTGPGSTGGGSDKPVEITLNAGWNQIGNPYTYAISWSDIQSDGANSGLSLQPNLRLFKNGAFSNGTGLESFQGGFIFVNSGTKLTYPSQKKNGRQMALGEGESGGNEDEDILYKTTGENQWLLPMEVQGVKRKIMAGVGMHPEAGEGFDRFDDFTLPRMSEYVELNHLKTLHETSYSRDVIAPAPNHAWEFEVLSSEAGEKHRLTWGVPEHWEGNKQLRLWDVQRGRSVDMLTQTQYEFRAPGSFRILYGDEAFVEKESVVRTFLLQDPSPNPTTGRVRVSFLVPDDGRLWPVELTVFDQHGRESEGGLKGKFGSGLHEVELDLSRGEGSAVSGMYLLRCQTGQMEYTRKVLVR
ncbi:MAG: T9SS type A sorting domain-containing protein [Bacteroidetes bacterium]|nr:T9SS type A sorting domain-containing protein [Bacteroidota bacterium]